MTIAMLELAGEDGGLGLQFLRLGDLLSRF